MGSHSTNPTVTVRRVFGRGSPVLDYWLGHSEGFELTSSGGGHRGVVEEVLVDERGYASALVVRGGVLQRAQLVDVKAVEAVVPADGTITLRSSRRRRPAPRLALPAGAVRNGGAAFVDRVAALARIAWRAAVLVLALAGAVARRSMRRLWRDVPVGARRAGRAGASAAARARPHAGTLVRLAAAAAATAALFVVALAQALAHAIAAYGSFFADEWTRRRSGSAPPDVRFTRK